MGNDIAAKKKRSDSQDSIRENNQIRDICLSYSKNKPLSNRNPIFLEKRKRFCELVKNQLFKRMPKDQEVDLFFSESRKIVNINNKNINIMMSVDETIEEHEYEEDISHSFTKSDLNKRKECLFTNDKTNNIANRTTGFTDNMDEKVKISIDFETNINEYSEKNKSNSKIIYEESYINSKLNFDEKRKLVFDNHNYDRIRNKFYQSLLNRDYIQKTKEKSISNNVFIFDWDDTIMCTTFITPTGYFTEKNLKEIEKRKDYKLFKDLEEVIFKTLTFAIGQGDVFIITNAASGWVEYSTRIFFPNILPLLSKIIIISARGWFEKEFPRNSKMWKFSCFEELGKIYNLKLLTNLVVIGDSLIEMEAAYLLGKKFECCYVKTIKMKDAPSPKQLLKQLKLLYSELPNICEVHQNLLISIQKERTSVERLSRTSKINQFRSTTNLFRYKEDKKTNSKIITRDLKRFSVI